MRTSLPQVLTAEIDEHPVEAEAVASRRNPTQLDRPALLLNFPFSDSTGNPNNAWMKELRPRQQQPDHRRAAIQLLGLYRSLCAEAVVYLLPTPRAMKLQDSVLTAHLGIVLEHVPQRNTVVISNFTSEPHRGETEIGVRFFRDMGYDVLVAPATFKGEAELKHIHDHNYLGGGGTRSEKESYDWMERTFDMRIVRLRLLDPYLYHLDCVIFPITKENTLVCTELLERSEIAEIEKVTNIVPVSAEACYSGICNSVRLPTTVLNASHVHELKAGTEGYAQEVAKNRALEDIAANLALEVAYVNLSEYHKTEALLSCMVLHLNRYAYRTVLKT
jgi:N-dimethylarginine dimethylaminohydrolase